MNPHGAGRIRGMILVLLLVLLALVAYRLIPVYINAYDFEDAMRTQARFAAVDQKPYEAIREELYNKAQELNLPIERDQIQISKGPDGTTISATFTVPVDLSFFVKDVEFNFSVKGQ
ncbi:MAG TPA: hypothetical protein VM182_02125 [Terriglobia bacterium]|nr:hypothetical protein [Terriglobia bacterium]